MGLLEEFCWETGAWLPRVAWILVLAFLAFIAFLLTPWA